MARVSLTLALFVLLVTGGFAQDTASCNSHEWSGVRRYRQAQVAPTRNGPRVVLIGASFVENMDVSKNFPAGNYINRGISGQGTAQMLLRFYQDVISLTPRVVVLFPGLNDLSAAHGNIPMLDIQQNLSAMAQLAKANNIRVVFASLLPLDPNGTSSYAKTVTSEKVRELNRWMFLYAKDHGDTYTDLWSPLGDAKYNLLPQYSVDGVDINEEGYKVLVPVLEKRVAEALAKPVGRVSVKGDHNPED